MIGYWYDGFPICCVCITDTERSYLEELPDDDDSIEPFCSRCTRNILEVYMTEC